ncbi:hypothetical protein D3C71_1067900 [compost metagenome]
MRPARQPVAGDRLRLVGVATAAGALRAGAGRTDGPRVHLQRHRQRRRVGRHAGADGKLSVGRAAHGVAGQRRGQSRLPDAGAQWSGGGCTGRGVGDQPAWPDPHRSGQPFGAPVWRARRSARAGVPSPLAGAGAQWPAGRRHARRRGVVRPGLGQALNAAAAVGDRAGERAPWRPRAGPHARTGAADPGRRPRSAHRRAAVVLCRLGDQYLPLPTGWL